MSLFSKDVGIDLGTANTLVYMKGKGIIMREPSVVAVDTKSDEVRCVGAEAKAVIGRTPGSIVAVRPLKDGVIADFDITANMLETFLKKACGNSMFSRPRVVICIPSGVTEVERRAVREAALKAGARQVSVIEEPMAAAIGADLLILLSDIDGLYDSDPRRNPDAQLIETVPVIDAHILSLAGDKGSALATGGMVTKLHAAQIATAAGCEMVIANGEKPEVLYDIVDGRRAGTRFLIPHS